MIFNSLTYLTFLALFCALYWFLPRKQRLWMLFCASLIFYGFWDWAFIPLLLVSVVVDFTAGQLLERLPDGPRRRAVLLVAVGINLLILGIFKYTIFFTEQFAGLSGLLGFQSSGDFSVGLHIVLPLGISFYTFQSMSYTIDVWRRVYPAQREFVLFATYVIFFPQLIAGPILRAGEVIWQLDQRVAFAWDDMGAGVRRVLSGLFLKCVLADNLAPLVDAGFARDAAELGALDVMTLSFLFGFQIYFDFAGYSHIALGSARLMGIRLPENFNFPYLATNMREFWRCWHISLSSWIRDYLYLPLCGVHGGTLSREGLAVAVVKTSVPHSLRRTAALWITWFLMGLWHGANWTFVIWGLWHAGLIGLQRVFASLKLPRVPGVIAWAITLPLVMLGWIPFRAETVAQTLELWGRLLTVSAWSRPATEGSGIPFWLALSRDSYYVAASVLIAIMLAAFVNSAVLPRLASRPLPASLAEGIAFAFAVPLIFLFLQQTEQFIYFQF